VEGGCVMRIVGGCVVWGCVVLGVVLCGVVLCCGLCCVVGHVVLWVVEGLLWGC
jgi:hypothetical protein